MIVCHALGMIRQDFNHAALGDPAALTLSHHALKLGFENGQAGNPGFHFSQVSPRNPVSLLA